MTKKIPSALLASLVMSVLPIASAPIVNAQGEGSLSAEGIIQSYLNITFGQACDTTQITGIFCIIGKLILYLLTTVGVISLIMMAVGGIQYMVSGGDEKAITSAKSTLTYAVLGLFIVILASAIVSTVLTVFGSAVGL